MKTGRVHLPVFFIFIWLAVGKDSNLSIYLSTYLPESVDTSGVLDHDGVTVLVQVAVLAWKW